MTKWSEEALANFRKIRESQTKYVMTEEHRDNLRKAAQRRIERDGLNPNFINGMKGKTHSEETKYKMRLAKLGVKKSLEHADKLRAALKIACQVQKTKREQNGK